VRWRGLRGNDGACVARNVRRTRACVSGVSGMARQSALRVLRVRAARRSAEHRRLAKEHCAVVRSRRAAKRQPHRKTPQLSGMRLRNERCWRQRLASMSVMLRNRKDGMVGTATRRRRSRW